MAHGTNSENDEMWCFCRKCVVGSANHMTTAPGPLAPLNHDDAKSSEGTQTPAAINVICGCSAGQDKEKQLVSVQLSESERKVVQQCANRKSPWRILCLGATRKHSDQLTPTDKWALLVLKIYAATQRVVCCVPGDVLTKLNPHNDRVVATNEIDADDLFEWLNPHRVINEAMCGLMKQQLRDGDERGRDTDYVTKVYEFKREQHWSPETKKTWSKQQLCAIFLALRRLCQLAITIPTGDNSCECTVELPWLAGHIVTVRLLRLARALSDCHNNIRVKQEHRTWADVTGLPVVLVDVICDYFGDRTNVVWKTTVKTPRYGRHYIPYVDLIDSVTLSSLQTEQLFSILRQNKNEFVHWESFNDLPLCLMIQYPESVSSQMHAASGDLFVYMQDAGARIRVCSDTYGTIECPFCDAYAFSEGSPIKLGDRCWRCESIVVSVTSD